MPRVYFIEAHNSENITCRDDRKIIVGSQIKQIFENKDYTTKLNATE